MRDMKEAIKNAIDNYDEHGESVELTDREKELIEYGYVQCSLQIGYDIVSKGESFMVGLQEMVLKSATPIPNNLNLLNFYRSKLKRLNDLKLTEPNNSYHDWDKEIEQTERNISEILRELN